MAAHPLQSRRKISSNLVFRGARLLALALFLAFGMNACNSSNFSPEYISANKGNYTLEIPEVQELVKIVMALTETGQKDPDIINRNTAYYRRVMETFKQYSDEAVVKEVDALLKPGFLRGGIYHQVKMDACGFYFEGETIRKDSNYNVLNWVPINYIEGTVPRLQEFARKTKFREFYTQNKPYYDSLIAAGHRQMPIRTMWKWLEDRFPARYDNYRITFSPLTGGNHSTNKFGNENFRQTVMFVSAPYLRYSAPWTEGIATGFMSRIVFTEIDHNYVNPVSDTFKNEINTVFQSREKWTKSSTPADTYPSTVSVFNEYMTWAVFTLYAEEQLASSDFDFVNSSTETQMEQRRGFPKYRAFNQKLRELYKAQQTKNIVELYKPMLEWAKQQ